MAEVASSTEADAQGYVFINGRRVRMITSKPGAPKKRRPAISNAGVEPTAAEKEAKDIKTPLTRKQLNAFQKLLLEKRAELIGDLSAIEQEALRSGNDNSSHMPIHMADIGTDTYDQDFMLGMAENERKQLREINEALERISDRTYGVCQMTGEPIPLPRLEAKPWAKYTIEAARQLEGQWSP